MQAFSLCKCTHPHLCVPPRGHLYFFAFLGCDPEINQESLSYEAEVSWRVRFRASIVLGLLSKYLNLKALLGNYFFADTDGEVIMRFRCMTRGFGRQTAFSCLGGNAFDGGSKVKCNIWYL